MVLASGSGSLWIARRLLLAACAVLAACRYPELPAIGDDTTGDGGVAAIDDARGSSDAVSGVPVDSPLATPTCMQHWLDGGASLVIGQPQLVDSLFSTNFGDRDPWISRDGLRMYFSRSPGVQGGYDIYLATRAGVADDFSNPAVVVNINTGADDNRASLSGDEKTMVFTSKQQSGQAKIFITQSDGTSFPTPPSSIQNLVDPINANSPMNGYYDPFLSADSLRMYLAPIPATTGTQYIAMASRTDVGKPFSAAMTLGSPIDTTSGEADPALSLDERVILFSSRRNGL